MVQVLLRVKLILPLFKNPSIKQSTQAILYAAKQGFVFLSIQRDPNWVIGMSIR